MNHIEPHQLIEMFLAERDVEKITIASYHFHLQRFFAWVKRSLLDAYQLTKADVILYKQSLKDENKSPLTISTYLTTLRLFYKWCDKNNFYKDITTSIRIQKQYRDFKKKSLSIAQATKFVQSLNSKTLIEKRDRAIANLMIRNGLRVIEVIRLDITDLQNDGEKISLTVQRKGRTSKDQSIPISPQTFEYIKEYLIARKDNWIATDPMFISHGHRNHKGRLNKQFISIMIKRKLRSMGLNDTKFTAHSLRHTTATLLLHNGTPEHEIQLMMGHSSFAITQIYTREKDQQLLFKHNPTKRMDAILI